MLSFPTAPALSFVQRAAAPMPNNTPAYLTTEALMSYCQSRLRDLDGRVAKLFAEQRHNADGLADVQRVQADLMGLTGGIHKDGRAAHDLIRSFQAAICHVGADSRLGQELTRIRDAFIARVGENGGAELRSEMAQPDYWTRPLGANADGQAVKDLSAEDLKPIVEQMKNLGSEVGQGMELGMISLQSLMSQRQMAIQIATSLVQSVGEMTNKIAQNIGR